VVKIQVSAKGAFMQWQHRVGEGEFTDIPGATSEVLEWSSATVDLSGEYRFVVSSSTGESVTSQIAAVSVDPTFTKITEGPVVTDRAARIWESPSWWDYDNDGYLDLFVGQFDYRDSVSSAMYHNNGDGTFTKLTNVITTHRQGAPIGAVADYDNDGNEDLIVVNLFGAEGLFRNDGQGDFTLQTSSQAGPPVGDLDGSATVGWADYDRDGFIDLFAANSFAGFGNSSRSDCLYRNNGDGSFTKMNTNQVGILVGDQAPTGPFSWADYDNDGWPDLWVGSANATSTPIGKQYLWHNNGDGTFSLVSAGSLNSNVANGNGLWADYDNDGDLDLFLTAYTGANSLHRNDGGLTFSDVSETAGVANAVGAWAAAWGDYDNDGFLDLMVPRYTTFGGVLYRNNGDATFTSIDVGSPVREIVNGVGVAWADYDNDGFLDLLITSESAGPNFLYRNNGNGNHWLKARLVGTASNRSAIGAKLRVRATIRGQTIWQMREITGNSGEDGGSGGLVAHFGLGDATKVDTLRIEWPSGIVQELNDVEVDQHLQVVETQGLNLPEPLSIQTFELDATGVFHATVNCSIDGAVCVLESSSDLERWTKVRVGTSSGGTVELTDARAGDSPGKFYRVLVP
jgi:enediyne biosynthesis protein E4